MKKSKSSKREDTRLYVTRPFRFEEAVTYFCVACEYNLRLSQLRTTPMKAMDNWLLFKSRRLCFEVSSSFDIVLVGFTRRECGEIGDWMVTMLEFYS